MFPLNPVAAIKAVAEAAHIQAMREVAAMHDLAVSKHIASDEGTDDDPGFHACGLHVVAIRDRRTLCGWPMANCQICDRIIFPVTDDSNLDILITDLGAPQGCKECRWRFGEEDYDKLLQALRDYQHVVEMADPRPPEPPPPTSVTLRLDGTDRRVSIGQVGHSPAIGPPPVVSVRSEARESRRAGHAAPEHR